MILLLFNTAHLLMAMSCDSCLTPNFYLHYISPYIRVTEHFDNSIAIYYDQSGLISCHRKLIDTLDTPVVK